MDQENGDLEIYKYIMEHERYIETRSFASLGNFLTANAFMLAAWATLLNHRKTVGDSFGGLDLVLVLMSALGFLSGCGWGLLGARNWEHALRLAAESTRLGKRIEPKPGEGGKSLFWTFRTAQRPVEDAWWGKFKFSSHSFLASKIPLGVASIHLALFVYIAWGRVFPWSPEPNWWLPGALGFVGLGWLVHLCSWCNERSDAAFNELKRAHAELGENGQR
jgi:hypothetical protein